MLLLYQSAKNNSDHSLKEENKMRKLYLLIALILVEF
jgi:hypothetical protein